MKEINKPVEPTYFRAHGPGVVHDGVTDPGLVTTTGQPNLVFSADPAEFAGMVAISDSPIEPMPAIGEPVERGRVYDNAGTIYVAVQNHTRTEHNPSMIPAMFTPARTQLTAWVLPTGAQDAYAINDRVTHNNPNDGGNIWVYRSKIDANTTEPGRDGTFDRWWEPVRLL